MADETIVNGAAAEPADAIKAPDRIVVPLEKPVVAHGDEIKELSFRIPTGSDIEVAGHPVVIEWAGDGTPRFVPLERKMSAMMAQLATVPPSTIKQLTSNDWTNCAYKLLGFFVPRLTT